MAVGDGGGWGVGGVPRRLCARCPVGTPGWPLVP